MCLGECLGGVTVLNTKKEVYILVRNLYFHLNPYVLGMPHIHMLLILDKNAQITTPEQVDQFVSARIPSLPPMTDTSVQANQQRRLWHYVTSMMLHDCNKACLTRRTIRGKETDVCSKNFPKPYSDQTTISGLLLYDNTVLFL